MKQFKTRWDIENNRQLVIPILGILGLLYSAYKLAGLFFDRTDSAQLIYLIPVTIIIYFVLQKITLYAFEKVKGRWIVSHRWHMISIFLVFAITGSSSVLIGRPIIRLLGITKDNLNPILYWILFIVVSLIIYQILLVFVGWIFGQFQFFWNFEKKLLRRFGLKQLK